MTAQQIIDLIKDLENAINEAWAKEEHEAILNSLASILSLYSDRGIDVGTRQDNGDDLTKVIIQYHWGKAYKSILVLIRDVLFQVQKSLILLKEEAITDEHVNTLLIDSKNVLESAFQDHKKQIDKFFNLSFKSEKEKTQYILDNKIQYSPWHVLENQYRSLNEQSNALLREYTFVKGVSNNAASLKREIQNAFDKFKDEIKKVEETGITAMKLISNFNQADILGMIEQVTALIPDQRSHHLLSEYERQCEEIYDHLGKSYNIAIAIRGSELIYKELNFVRLFRVWIEGRAHPLLMEGQEFVDRARNNLHLNLVHIKERLLLSNHDKGNSNESSLDIDNLKESITGIVHRMNDDHKELEILERELKSILNNSFRVPNIYRPDIEFFDAEQQKLVSQLQDEAAPWVPSLFYWFNKNILNAKQLFKNVADEEKLSFAERTVRYVKNRTPAVDNFQYQNIFNTEGFMGESFWVGRSAELTKMKNLIEDWNIGFRGSVVLSGMRFCGKSVFGQIVSNRFFDDHTVRLRPNDIINLQGRTFETTHNISESIEFIKHHTVNQRYLIWIDDLELWQSSGSSLHFNVESLLSFIDSYANKHFILVSCSNWFLNHLDKFFNFSNSIQAEINLDMMSELEIRQAISIRHSATHKLLVDLEGDRIEPEEFERCAKRIIQYTRYNIGDALNMWSSFITKGEEGSVILSPRVFYSFPDILNDQNRIVVKSLLMNKYSNEYELNKSLGSSFQEKYKFIIRRLLSLGLLQRNTTDHLEANPFLVNELARQLQQDNYLKTQRWTN